MVGLAEVPTAELSPRGLPHEAVDALLRAAGREPSDFLRLRDQAALALLVYAGLRVQEVCDVQLRDLDLAAETITVRSGKGGKARRVPLHPDAKRLLAAYLDQVRCPAGLPAIGAEEEREALLLGQEVTKPGQPLRPGITPALIRHRVRVLGRQAGERMQEHAKRELDLLRADELRQAAGRLLQVSPHQLRHSLARRLLATGSQLTEVQRILGHSRLSTTGIYLTPSEDDLRAGIGRAGV